MLSYKLLAKAFEILNDIFEFPTFIFTFVKALQTFKKLVKLDGMLKIFKRLLSHEKGT